jgi:signal transduction histidine kinase/DNA-binding NarL/FixJ family response regulator
MYSRQQSLRESSRYDLAWTTGQAAQEYLRLQLAVSRVLHGGTKEEVGLRYGIALSRMQVLSAGEAAEFLATRPVHAASVRRAAAALAQIEPWIERIDQPGVAEQVIPLLTPMTGPLIGLSSIAHRDGAERIAGDEGDLFFLHWVFTALVALLICLGVGLIMLLSRRMTELRTTKATLEKTAVQLTEALTAADAGNLAKSTFLATMSHEIRTPLNAMLGLTGSLMEDLGTGPHRGLLETIRDAGDSLLRLLNDILDFSKLDAGRMTMEEVAFSPAALSDSVASILEPRAKAKPISLTQITKPDLPAGLLGDPGRIEQILVNLVSNAVKFTDQGNVTIMTSCERSDHDQATIVWRVTDTGIGIPADRLDKLFTEFMQADNSITRRFGGTGLGLAISKRLVDQMNGTITVESTVGVGTSFTVRLTLARASDVVPATTGRDETDDTVGRFKARIRDFGRPLRILFVEDNPTNQYVATRLFKGFNVQIDMAGNGLEALDYVSRVTPDLICMDMRMPEMDGLEATREIRRMGGRMTHVPIIALTANAFKEDVDACLAAGMNRFVGKPVRRDLLLNAMLAELPAVGISQMPASPQKQLEGPAAAHAPSPPSFDAESFSEMVEMIGDDGVAEMVETFEIETRARLQRLRTGGQDITTIVREMHTLKGAAGTASAPHLAAIGLALEQAAKHGSPPTPDDLQAIGDALDAFLAEVRAWHTCHVVAA